MINNNNNNVKPNEALSSSRRELNDNINSPASTTRKTIIMATLYVLSGVTQPLIMTLVKHVGIASPRAQVYMAFYYLGPACATFFVKKWPTPSDTLKAVGIFLFDLFAQSINYTASTMAGPTLFAIIYSSVTVWTAVFSRLFLKRSLSVIQWTGVGIVFGGLAITGWSSVELGRQVLNGCLLVILGSASHALTYVGGEVMMTHGTVTVETNCALQGLTGSSCLILWQLFYTWPHFQKVIVEPVEEANSTWIQIILVLVAFGLTTLVHAFSYFHTLNHCPGGATSAGVMKGLQAVLVFVATSLTYCGRLGGPEMCFSSLKLLSLVIVLGGVIMFGKGTQDARRREGYDPIENAADDDDATADTELEDGGEDV